MTIQIQSPANGGSIAPDANDNIYASGTIDCSDDVDGMILDLNSGNSYPGSNEQISTVDGITWNWSLTFYFDPNGVNPQQGDALTVYVYDAITGGDTDTVSETASVNFQMSGSEFKQKEKGEESSQKKAKGTPSLSIVPIPALPAEVQDIFVTINLSPGANGSVFLVLAKKGADAKIASTIIESHRLPPSTKNERKVTFREIDVGYWDHICVAAAVKKHTCKPCGQKLK